ncbi:urea transporter [Nostoc sp. CCY0012]|uniref:urea transporter n=1 Tax=Nostoc sp. CCY0012 TaxID=1056123 RepID=UPI0039C6A613
MVEQNSLNTSNNETLPLHELMARILVAEETSSRQILPFMGTMQWLNDYLTPQSFADFVNTILRGIGQVIFVNNPLSGLLILVAILLQSPWMALMALLGVIASTLTAIALKINPDVIRNGIFGFQGTLVGLALATFGSLANGNGAWNPLWAIAVIILAALTTVLMNTFGGWFTTHFKVSILGIPFHIVTQVFLYLVLLIPQPYFHWGFGIFSVSASASKTLDWLKILASFPISFSQVFFVSNQNLAILVFLAVALCTPIGAGVGLLGCLTSAIAALVMGIDPEKIYTGFWGFNSVLTAIAIGGMFYAPNFRSILIAGFSVLICTLCTQLLSLLFSPLGIPFLALPFCLVTIGCFLVVQHSLPSLVPVALYTITSPEEHRLRYLTAKNVIFNFRRQLESAIQGTHHRFLFHTADPSLKGNLRYIFDAIDQDHNGTLSVQEFVTHLHKANATISEAELAYLFSRMDIDKSGEIDFEEFGELMLRHRRLMSKYQEFITYFLPIDTDEDESISIEEMNVALSSVGECPLSQDEIIFLQTKTGGNPLSWHRFIEVLLVC